MPIIGQFGKLESKVGLKRREFGTPSKYDVDASAVKIWDASSYPNAIECLVSNVGNGDLYIYIDNTIVAGSSGKWIYRLVSGEDGITLIFKIAVPIVYLLRQ